MFRWKFILFLSFLILIFSTYVPKENTNNNGFFMIKNILIEGDIKLNLPKLEKKFSTIEGKNLFFISKTDIEKILDSFNTIKKVEIKKIYPDTIKLNIEEKKIIGATFRNGKKFLIIDDSNLIKISEINKIKSKDLIIVEGNIENYLKLYENFKSIDFDTRDIKSVKYHDIGRWDVELKNGIKIKLPVENYVLSLKNFLSLQKEKKIMKFSIFDYRIKDELILK